MRYILGFFILLFILACGNNLSNNLPEHETATTPSDSAQWIIDQAILQHGGENYDKHRISFDFRNRHYVSTRQGGQFTYERIWQDTSGDNYRDVLNNEMLYREINGKAVSLSTKDSSAYANSVNSVIYFVLLPYFLNDPAVQKEYLGLGRIKGQSYYKVKVFFEQEGGGKDFEDQFIYWIHIENHTLDYLAYNYLTDGGGARFREAYNVRAIEGIRFADYINYKPISDTKDVERFDVLFNEGQMKEVSRIDSENIEVQLSR